MYPFIKLTTTLIRAAFRPKLTSNDISTLNLRAGLTDIDIFMELNNARYLNYLEMGRWDYSYRIGLLSLMRKNNWGVAIGGVSARYRRRIPFFRKFTLSTQMVCHDGRWFYFLQEIHSKNKICFSALIKACITSKDGLVPAPDVVNQLGQEHWNPDIPEWVSAWIEAEGKRPWPTE